MNADALAMPLSFLWHGHAPSAPLNSFINYLDAHSGAATVLLTFALVVATFYANHVTRTAINREWHPSLHIRVIEPMNAGIEIVNLGRMAIVVTEAPNKIS